MVMLNLVYVTMFFANRAEINVGVIITIWSLEPILNQIAAYFLFDEKIHYYHVIGLVSILLCSICISLKDMLAPAVKGVKEVQYPSWIPVVFGLITPMSFCSNAMLAKNLTSERIGFDPSTLSMSSIISVNFIILVIAIAYWVQYGFILKYFWIGSIGMFIDSYGLSACTEAFACGPPGSVAAIVSSANVLMVIIEAIKHNRMLTIFESIGFVLAVFGILVLSLPEVFEKYCFCWCVKKKINKA